MFLADDAMDAWDQEKLEDVVNKKHGTKNKGLPPTTIVSNLHRSIHLNAFHGCQMPWFSVCQVF